MTYGGTKDVSNKHNVYNDELIPFDQNIFYHNKIFTFVQMLSSFLTFGLWGYSFHVPLGYYKNIFYYNVVFLRRVVC